MPFLGRGAGSPYNTMSPGLTSAFRPSGVLIHPAVWLQQAWAENWGLCPFGGRAGSPSNTMWPGLRPISVPSLILIHATVCPQYTNITADRQDRQTTVRQHRVNRFTNGRPVTMWIKVYQVMKAFDKVPHKRFLHKLQARVIGGEILT